MDKKAKKRLGVIHKKLQSLQLQLSGARQQDDEVSIQGTGVVALPSRG